MPATCGLACEVCGFADKGICPVDRCVAGTDPKAPEKQEKFAAAMGHPCAFLDCAITNKVDHCTRCDSFPCKTHYEQGGPYSKQTLDMIKGMLSQK